MADIIELHDRITVTFSPEISKLIREEIERQRREYPHRKPETAEEIASDATKMACEAMAVEYIEVKRT